VIETPRPESVGPIKVIDELEAYLNEPGVPMEVPVNPIDPESELHATKPLEFWKANSSRFPILSQIARDAVSVAASSGSIKRVFSTTLVEFCRVNTGVKLVWIPGVRLDTGV
jgi:hypothetical protein